MTVHRELHGGLLEEVYQEALAIEFDEKDFNYEREKLIEIFYKGQKLKKFYKADFLCFNKIVVELKSVERLIPEHRAQLINYLRLSNKPVGLLINFGDSSLKCEKYIFDESTNNFKAF
jgi:GxxExxY protein